MVFWVQKTKKTSEKLPFSSVKMRTTTTNWHVECQHPPIHLGKAFHPLMRLPYVLQQLQEKYWRVSIIVQPIYQWLDIVWRNILAS